LRFCTSNAITVQPGTDDKLNPFNTEWHTAYFDSCSPITDGDCSSFYLKIISIKFQVLYIVVADAFVRVDCTDALVRIFSRVVFRAQRKHYEQKSEWLMAFM
jgi:hypothetical protein